MGLCCWRRGRGWSGICVVASAVCLRSVLEGGDTWGGSLTAGMLCCIDRRLHQVRGTRSPRGGGWCLRHLCTLNPRLISLTGRGVDMSGMSLEMIPAISMSVSPGRNCLGLPSWRSTARRRHGHGSWEGLGGGVSNGAGHVLRERKPRCSDGIHNLRHRIPRPSLPIRVRGCHSLLWLVPPDHCEGLK